MATTRKHSRGPPRRPRPRAEVRHVPVQHDHAQHRRDHRVGPDHRPLHRRRLDCPTPKIATVVEPDHPLPAADPHRLHRRQDRLRRQRGGVRRGDRPSSASSLATLTTRSSSATSGGSPHVHGRDDHGPARRRGCMKRLDALWQHRIKPGFEMLVNNFSAGILAALMAIFGMFALAPVLRLVIDALGNAVDFLVDNGLLPLTSLFIEPAKVMFLNNAINHGVLTPLGVEEAAEAGKSVLFLLEANPGPGLGLLLAYTFFGRGVAKATAPGARDHPVLRRHPRGLLPVRADEAEDDPRDHRRRHDRHLPDRAVRRRAARPGGSRIDLRRLRADSGRRLPRHHAGSLRCGGRVVPGRLGAPQAGQDRRGGRPRGRPPPRWSR